MHIFSLSDEYEKENKLQEEADKNWLEPKVGNTLTQGFGDFKSVENYSSEKKDNQDYEQDEQDIELKDAATNILKSLGKEVTQQSIKDTVDILKTNSDKNAIVEAGSFIAKADLVYINVGISSSTLAKVLPISDEIKEYLSLGVNFVYIKSLDDCYILAGFGAGKTTGASISFMYLSR